MAVKISYEEGRGGKRREGEGSGGEGRGGGIARTRSNDQSLGRNIFCAINVFFYGLKRLVFAKYYSDGGLCITLNGSTNVMEGEKISNIIAVHGIGTCIDMVLIGLLR